MNHFKKKPVREEEKRRKFVHQTLISETHPPTHPRTLRVSVTKEVSQMAAKHVSKRMEGFIY